MYVFRIHIRPQGGSASMEDTFKYCLKNGLLGVGWQIDAPQTLVNWEYYLAEAEKLYGKVLVCKYIKRWVSKGDLVWTRDHEGNYYLARVKSGWEYSRYPEAIEKDIDISNVFKVQFVPVDLAAVPGKVIACFRATRTIQEIASDAAVEYTKYLWNTLTDTNTYQVNKAATSDIFEFLDAEETEDLVFLYMQKLGWYIVPGTRKKDTMRFEFMAVDPKTGNSALSQVKTGSVPLDQNEYADRPETVFLFQSREIYTGHNHKNVRCLRRSELLEFMQQAYSWLPAAIRNKLDVCRFLSGAMQ